MEQEVEIGQETSLPEPKPSPGHRSRKEKLVIRSFSTEVDEGMEPRILSHAEFFGASSKAKRGSRTRRTASAPVTSGQKMSRESSPAREGEEGEARDSKDLMDILVENVAVADKNSKIKVSPRKYRKRKHVDYSPEDVVDIEEELDEFTPIIRKRSLLRGKLGKGRNYPNRPKRRLEWSEEELKKARKSLLNKSSPTKFLRRSPIKSHSKKGSFPIMSSNSSKVTFQEPMAKSPDSLFFARTSPDVDILDSENQPPTLPKPLTPPARRIVKYKVNEKFAKTRDRKLLITGEEICNTEDAALEPSLPPPPPPVTPKHQSSAPFLEDGLVEDSQYEKCFYDKLEEYKAGLASLQKMMHAGYHVDEEEENTISVGMADVCEETIAKLAKLARKNRSENDSDELCSSDSDNESSETENEVNQHSQSSDNPFLSFTRKLIMKTEKIQELKLLSELNENGTKEAQQPQKFILEAFYGKKSGHQRHPRITSEELEVFDELLEEDEYFECFDDEQEAANVYCEIIRSELTARKNMQKQTKEVEALANFKKEGEGGARKKVNALSIPINFKEGENEHGFYVTKEDFAKLFVKGKENQLKQLNTRRLRNGKEVPLKKLYLRKSHQSHKKHQNSFHSADREDGGRGGSGRRSFSEGAATVPADAAAISRLHTPAQMTSSLNRMRLRDGKMITFPDNSAYSTILRGSMFNIEVPDTLEDGDNIAEVKQEVIESSTKNDEYSRRVAANLKRLEAGGVEIDLTPIPESPLVISQRLMEERAAAARCRTQPLGRLTAFSLPSSTSNPEFNMNMFFGRPLPSSTIQKDPSTTSLSTATAGERETPDPNNSSFIFHPIQPYPLTMEGNEHESRTPPSSSSPWPESLSPSKCRYSRQRHSNLCPPFDNNHCSYNTHHCSYPRVASSRFCIQHVDEGATVNFERCKYVKGSRECGLYIPRSNAQILFCDIHALKIANARVNKTIVSKSAGDKVDGLLKHLRCNLDRAQGKIMEPDGLGRYFVRKDLIDDERETLNNASDSGDSEDDLKAGDIYRATKGDDDSDVDDCDATTVEGNEPDYSCLKNAGYYTVDECVRMHRTALLKTKEKLQQEVELLKRKLSYDWNIYRHKLRHIKNQRIQFTTDPHFLATSTTAMKDEQIQYELEVHNATEAILAHRKDKGARGLLRQQVLRKRQEIFEASRPGGNATTAEIYSTNPLHPLETKEEIKMRVRKHRKGRPYVCTFGKPLPIGEKCDDPVFPLSRYCFKHIINDKFQKLYIPCNFGLGPDADDVCKVPVWSELAKFGCPLHALPVPLKDPPESQNRKPKQEEEIDLLMEEPEMESESDITLSSDKDEEETEEEDMVREMEELVGDEVVDLEHFRESVTSLYTNGIIYLSDSEESEDTDEEEQQPPPPPPEEL